jgi:CubicO group peptidase (beta-lactamase class C family)
LDLRLPSALFAIVTTVAACSVTAVAPRPGGRDSSEAAVEGPEEDGPDAKNPGEEPPGPPFDTKDLDAFVEQRLAAASIPGVSVALVKGGKVVAARAYGLADRETNRPMQADTILEVASISKTVTGVALLQLVAAGKVALDADISTYLERPIRNPGFAQAITPKMLVTHTSSIRSDNESLGALFVENADSTLPLADLTREFLEPGGRHYAGSTFSGSAPGTAWDYCNVCIGLVGHIVERASGTSLQALTKKTIFAPLGMSSTAWTLAETDRARLVTPYAVNPSTQKAEATPHFGLPDWPAGSLKTTASDLAKFAAAMSTGGGSILPKAEVDEMLRVHFPGGGRTAPDQGLSFMRERAGGVDTWGHSGSLPGIASVMSFRANEGMAVVVLANTDVEVAEPTLLAIQDKAYELLLR